MKGWEFIDFVKDEQSRGAKERGWMPWTKAVQGAIMRILMGYRDNDEAMQAAEDFSERDALGCDIYGFPKSPRAVADAVAEVHYLKERGLWEKI